MKMVLLRRQNSLFKLDEALTMPQRIQRKRTKGWRMPPGVVHVGRGTRYGNPFRVSQIGREEHNPPALGTCMNAAAVARKFRTTSRRREVRNRDRDQISELDEACHADLLLEEANK